MIKFHTLGTSHGAAEYGRSCSVNILEVNGRYYVFDCGGNIETKMKDLDMPMSNIKAVFISHMHEDHAGSLSAIGKHFTVYNSSEEKVKIMMPEAEGIRALRAWMLALHLNEQKLERLEFEEIFLSGFLHFAALNQLVNRALHSALAGEVLEMRHRHLLVRVLADVFCGLGATVGHPANVKLRRNRALGKLGVDSVDDLLAAESFKLEIVVVVEQAHTVFCNLFGAVLKVCKRALEVFFVILN